MNTILTGFSRLLTFRINSTTNEMIELPKSETSSAASLSAVVSERGQTETSTSRGCSPTQSDGDTAKQEGSQYFPTNDSGGQLFLFDEDQLPSSKIDENATFSDEEVQIDSSIDASNNPQNTTNIPQEDVGISRNLFTASKESQVFEPGNPFRYQKTKELDQNTSTRKQVLRRASSSRQNPSRFANELREALPLESKKTNGINTLPNSGTQTHVSIPNNKANQSNASTNVEDKYNLTFEDLKSYSLLTRRNIDNISLSELDMLLFHVLDEFPLERLDPNYILKLQSKNDQGSSLLLKKLETLYIKKLVWNLLRFLFQSKNKLSLKLLEASSLPLLKTKLDNFKFSSEMLNPLLLRNLNKFLSKELSQFQ